MLLLWTCAVYFILSKEEVLVFYFVLFSDIELYLGRALKPNHTSGHRLP